MENSTDLLDEAFGNLSTMNSEEESTIVDDESAHGMLTGAVSLQETRMTEEESLVAVGTVKAKIEIKGSEHASQGSILEHIAKDIPGSTIEQEQEPDNDKSSCDFEPKISTTDNILAMELIELNSYDFGVDDGTKDVDMESEVNTSEPSENTINDDRTFVENKDIISKEQMDSSDAETVKNDMEQADKIGTKATIGILKASDDAGLSILDSLQLNLDENSTSVDLKYPVVAFVPLLAAKSNDSEGEILRSWSRDGDSEKGRFAKMVRKAGVAVTGGSLVIVGLPMIPMPTPGGVIVVGSGMAVLATEFPAARRALDRSRKGLANMVGDESDDDEEKKQKKKKAYKIADLVFEDEDAAKKKLAKNKARKILNPLYGSKKGQPMFNNDDMKELKGKTVNAAKVAKKNVKRFIRGTVLPLMERMTSSSDGTVSSKSDRGEEIVTQHRLRLGSRNDVQPPSVTRFPQKIIQDNISGNGVHEF